MSESVFSLYVLVLKKFEVLFEDEEKLVASCHNLTNFYNRHCDQGQRIVKSIRPNFEILITAFPFLTFYFWVKSIYHRITCPGT